MSSMSRISKESTTQKKSEGNTQSNKFWLHLTRQTQTQYKVNS